MGTKSLKAHHISVRIFFPTTVVVIQFIRGSCLSIGANIELSANGICQGEDRSPVSLRSSIVHCVSLCLSGREGQSKRDDNLSSAFDLLNMKAEAEKEKLAQHISFLLHWNSSSFSPSSVHCTIEMKTFFTFKSMPILGGKKAFSFRTVIKSFCKLQQGLLMAVKREKNLLCNNPKLLE